MLLLFIFVCAAASSISGYVGGYTSFVVFGIAILLVVAIGVKVSKPRDSTNRKSLESCQVALPVTWLPVLDFTGYRVERDLAGSAGHYLQAGARFHRYGQDSELANKQRRNLSTVELR